MQINHRYHTEAEQTALLRCIRQFRAPEAQRDAAWINLLRLSGMRIGEFSRVTVRQARLALEQGWLFIPKEHRKGKREDHSVLVTEPMRADLRALLDLQRQCGGSGADDEPLIWSRKGRAMSIRGYQDRYRHWCRKAGIQGSPHWARHTHAMNIMRRSTARDPRGIVQAALGHADISSSGFYTRVSKEELEAALRQVHQPGRGRRRDMRKVFEGVRS